MMTPATTVKMSTSPKLLDCTPMLAVRNVSLSRKFYVDHLGFESTSEYAPEGQLCWCNLVNGHLSLMLTLNSKADDSPKSAQLYIRVADVSSLHATLKDKGLRVSDLETRFYEMREFEVSDPDGYQLIFGQDVSGTSHGCSCGHGGCSS